MKKQYYVDSNYNYKDTVSALMDKMMSNVHSELWEMKAAFDKDNTAESYEHYKKAIAELDKLSFRKMENADIEVAISNWVNNYDQQ